MAFSELLLFLLGIAIFAGTPSNCQLAGQELVNYIANSINIRYAVVDNGFETGYVYKSQITFANEGTTPVVENVWEIFLCHSRTFEPNTIFPNGTELGSSGLWVRHINGCLFRISPMATFAGFQPGVPLIIPVVVSWWMVERTDITPNWYVTAPMASPRIIASTSGEELEWVDDFVTQNQYLRSPDDQYFPFTADTLYNKYLPANTGTASKKIIPTPRSAVFDENQWINIKTGDWLIYAPNSELMNEAEYLAETLNMAIVGILPASHYVSLYIDTLADMNSEAYTVHVRVMQEYVNITGNTARGVFWGIQTLLALAADPAGVPESTIDDSPRYGYRGQHLDIARNFHTKEEILKLVDTLSTYKISTLHLHLTEDEGWRLEIPGLPELTEIGARRCHDLTERTCIIPQLGSGPTSNLPGSGYLSVADYQEILRHARDRHVQVIPEFDMPGHGHAAIKAMYARYLSLLPDEAAATEFLLNDLNDTSDYMSVQSFNDNAINPCIESTYHFIDHVISETQKMHAGIQPLTILNFGGDEVPGGAWENSPACQELIASGVPLKKHFATRVANIAASRTLDLAAWEDGVMEGNNIPYNKTELITGEVFAYAWSNIWYYGGADRTYNLANADYKTIISHATYLYFDMPQAPDPEERGQYWAIRYIDTQRAFKFAPNNVYQNIDLDEMGNPVYWEDACTQVNCVPLQPGKEANIIGIQGQLWSEMVRSESQLDAMIYPRILALAERAWHHAAWEDEPDQAERQRLLEIDWSMFARALGQRELDRLEDMHTDYHLSPPGARVTVEGTLQANAEYPGQHIEFSPNNGATWVDYLDSTSHQMPPGSTALLRIRSKNGRVSRNSWVTAALEKVKKNTKPVRVAGRSKSIKPEINHAGRQGVGKRLRN